MHWFLYDKDLHHEKVKGYLHQKTIFCHIVILFPLIYNEWIF